MKIVLAVQDFIKKSFQVFESVSKIILISRVNLETPKRVCFEDCLILGNGPSLINDLNKFPDFLKNKDLICVNHFPSSELYEKLKPSIFVTTAPDLWLEDIDERFVKQSVELFNNLAERTDWPLEFYIPVEASKHKRWLKQVEVNQNIKIFYFNNTPLEGWDFFKFFCFDRKWGMPRPHNVLIPSLMISIWKGYEKIFLLGADHNWLSEISVTQKNEVLINQKHFYDENKSKALPLDKRGKGSRNLAELLHKFMTAFSSYFEIKAYSKYRKVNIYNATKGSFIDAFEKIDLEELYSDEK